MQKNAGTLAPLVQHTVQAAKSEDFRARVLADIAWALTESTLHTTQLCKRSYRGEIDGGDDRRMVSVANDAYPELVFRRIFAGKIEAKFREFTKHCVQIENGKKVDFLV